MESEPTPAELRELSRRVLIAAKTEAKDMKSLLEAHALALFRVAEQIGLETPMGEFVRNANIDRYKRLLDEVVDEKVRAIIQALLKGEQEAIERNLRDIREWRRRAEELRTIAHRCSIPSLRRTLLGIAASYDSLADHADARVVRHRSSGEDIA